MHTALRKNATRKYMLGLLTLLMRLGRLHLSYQDFSEGSCLTHHASKSGNVAVFTPRSADGIQYFLHQESVLGNTGLTTVRIRMMYLAYHESKRREILEAYGAHRKEARMRPGSKYSKSWCPKTTWFSSAQQQTVDSALS
jgi:hypothetical protein